MILSIRVSLIRLFTAVGNFNTVADRNVFHELVELTGRVQCEDFPDWVDLLAVFVPEDVVEERSLAGAEKAW